MKINKWILGIGILTLGSVIIAFTEADIDREPDLTKEIETRSLSTIDTNGLSEDEGDFQDMIFNFWTYGNYEMGVKAGTLQNIKTLDQLIEAYPGDLLEEHLSISLYLSSVGSRIEYTTSKDRLSAAQMDLIRSARLGDEIFVDVRFLDRNVITGNLEEREMNYRLTVIPDQEASFPGGREGIFDFLRDNSGLRLPYKLNNPMQHVLLNFNVNADGEVEHVRFIQDSGVKLIDKTLADALKKMPKWQPARMADGRAVFQSFQVRVTDREGC